MILKSAFLLLLLVSTFKQIKSQESLFPDRIMLTMTGNPATSGQKMYGLNTSFLSDRVASNTQLYQYINLNRNKLSYKSFTVTGDLYDDFMMVKNKKGLNRIVVSKELGGIEQRTQIPEGEETEYTIEELKKFRLKYQKQ